MRVTNSGTSSSAKAFSRESIRTAWRTLEKVSDGAAPTCSDGLSGSLSSGKAASIAALRRFSAS